MTKVITTPANGVKATPETSPVELKAEVKPIKKLTVEAEDLAPLEDRLHRLNELFEVQTKYNRLLSSKQKLNEFKLNKKSETIILRLVDSNDRSTEFETRNSEVIAEVMDCLRHTIEKKTKAIEPLIKW